MNKKEPQGIPSGYEIHISKMEDSKSMVSAYNRAMRQSEAKYKIYLHEDVFIVNRQFLKQSIALFEQDPKVGMIGMIGCKQLSQTGDFYRNWDCGNVIACDAQNVYTNELSGMQEVETVDGLLIMTSYDIEWREDVLDAFDFYDLSQSIEFSKRGYKILVPEQEKAWCIHDCGHTKWKNYALQLNKMNAAYPELFRSVDPAEVYQEEQAQITDIIRENVEQYLCLGQYQLARAILEKYQMNLMADTKIEVLRNIIEILDAETALIGSTQYVLEADEKLYETYNFYKFQLRRLEQNVEEIDALLQAMQEEKISYVALIIILKHTIQNKKYVLECLEDRYRIFGNEVAAKCCADLKSAV